MCPQPRLPAWLTSHLPVSLQNNAPASTVILRAVPARVRPVAMAAPFATGKVRGHPVPSLHCNSALFPHACGLRQAFGVIPGPILFGALIDSTCLFTTNGCDTDFCAVYDLPKFRQAWFLWAACAKVCRVRRPASGWW